MTKSATGNHARKHPSRWMQFVIRSRSIRGITWFMLACSLLATLIVCQQAWRRQAQARQHEFETEADLFRSTMDDRLHLYAHVLLGVAGLFNASISVDAGEFQAYVASLNLDHHFSGILALGYVEKVEPSELDAFLREIALDHDGPTNPFPATSPGERTPHMIIRFVEPLAANRPALGYDVGSETNQRQTAWTACDSGSVVLTAKLELVQSPGRPGSVLFQPVYSAGSDPQTPAERRAELQGWVYAAFHLEDLMAGVSLLNPNNLDYEIYDGTDPGPHNLLTSSSPHPARSSDRDVLEQISVMHVYGRPWTLRARAPASRAAGSGFLPVGLLAAGGTCTSLLIFGITHSIAGTSRRAVALAREMTKELRSRQRALRASEERLAMIIEGSNDGVWDWDMTTDDVFVSPRWKSMLGYEDHELENTFRSWERLIHPGDLEQARSLLRSHTRNAPPSRQLEYRLRHKDGSYRWILARGVVARNKNGDPIRMAGSHVDLTELKQAEQELVRTNESLQRSKTQLQHTLDDLQASHQELERTQLELIQAAKLESIGTLAAGVAHEVRNPLQIILMGLDYIDTRSAHLDQDGRVTLIDMRDAALRADSITHELLEFSSAAVFKPAPHDLETVLARTLHLMKTELTRSKVTLRKNLDGSLPTVCIDSHKIQQVLINLIQNAVQAMGHAGSLTISTGSGSHTHTLATSGWVGPPLQPEDEIVVLRLQDTGPGIPDEQLPRIFDPFFTTKPVGSGTGLGLAVAKMIIDLHGGLIDIRNSSQGGVEAVLAFKASRTGFAEPPATGSPSPPHDAGSPLHTTPSNPHKS